MIYFAARLYFMLHDLKFLFCSAGLIKHKLNYNVFISLIQPLAAYFFVFV